MFALVIVLVLQIMYGRWCGGFRSVSGLILFLLFLTFVRNLFQTISGRPLFHARGKSRLQSQPICSGVCGHETVRHCLAQGDFRSPEWLINGRESGAADKSHSQVRRR